MEAIPRIITMVIILFCALQPTAALNKLDGNHLHARFYMKTCPQAEKIVSQVVTNAFLYNAGIAAGLIRLHFHDCFISGCDASILLDTTPSGEVVEKDSPANGKSLRGLEVIDEAKARIEQECPGIVSCADILAFAARDAAVKSGLFYYVVPAGRRDGRSSYAMDTINLPAPSYSVEKLTDIFAEKGLSQAEMITLSGAHSIGIAHCSSFQNRLYFFDSKSNHSHDPSFDPFYAFNLKQMCPVPGEMDVPLSGSGVALDSISPHKLDNAYYMGLSVGRGLLSSDQALMKDRKTRKIVKSLALNPFRWSQKFGRAMVRMGRIDVLTGKQGEIRRDCRSVN